MLNILLLILKILGFTILGILGLLVFILLVVLFAPLKYKVIGEYYEKPYAKISVSWIFKIIRAGIIYDEKLSIKAKVLFFTVFNNLEEKKPKKEKTKKEKTKKEKPKKEKVDKQSNATDTLTSEKNNDSNKGIFDDKVKEDAANANSQKDDAKEKQPEVKVIIDGNKKPVVEFDDTFEKPYEEEAKKSIFVVIKEKILEIFNLVKNVINKVEGARDAFVEKYENIREKITNEDNKAAIAYIWKSIKELLKLIRPKKYKIKGRLGFEDPAKVGQTFMYISVLVGLLGVNLDIKPDFEQDIKEGEIMFKGHFCLFPILIIAFKLWRNKKVMALIGK